MVMISLQTITFWSSSRMLLLQQPLMGNLQDRSSTGSITNRTIAKRDQTELDPALTAEKLLRQQALMFVRLFFPLLNVFPPAARGIKSQVFLFLEPTLREKTWEGPKRKQRRLKEEKRRRRNDKRIRFSFIRMKYTIDGWKRHTCFLRSHPGGNTTSGDGYQSGTVIDAKLNI